LKGELLEKEEEQNFGGEIGKSVLGRVKKGLNSQEYSFVEERT